MIGRVDMKILITGFEAFDEERINPASQAVLNMKDEILGAEIIKHILPTVFGESIEVLEGLIEEHRPDIVLNIGQAGGSYDINVERIAINIDDARIKDNKGNQPIDEKIYQDGDNAYFSSLPIKAIVRDLKENNIPASVSNSAGTYVCNHIMYGLLYLIDSKYKDIRGGFIHVPYVREQIIDRPKHPFMEEEIMVRALEIIVETTIKNEEDIKMVGGKIF